MTVFDYDIVEARYVGDYRIELVFADGHRGIADLSAWVRQDTVFAPFADKEYFRAFRIEYGTLVWGEGDVDIAPEALYEEAIGERPRGHMIHTDQEAHHTA